MTEKVLHWKRGLRYLAAILLAPVGAFLLNAPILLFLHVMPATICYVVVPPDDAVLLDLCFILGQYHWVGEIAIIGLLVIPCFVIFYVQDCCRFRENRKSNRKHIQHFLRALGFIGLALVLSLPITAPYQIMILRVCRPGGYAMQYVTPPPGVVEHDSVYYFMKETTEKESTYPLAMETCKKSSSAMGYEPPFGASSHLVTIETNQQQQFITDYMKTYHNSTDRFRIGGIKEPPAWKYKWDKWTDGQKPFTVTHWAEDADKRGSGNCVAMERSHNVTSNVSYSWVPESCVQSRPLPFLCQMPAQLNYMLCAWVSGSLYVAVVLELFIFGFIIFRIIRLRQLRGNEFPKDIPQLVVTPADEDTDIDNNLRFKFETDETDT